MAGVADGLFAEHGLDVEILDPTGGPENVLRVAGGGADFCLTSVRHYLVARARAGDAAARFVAVVVQRSPMAALVAAASPLRTPADLAGRRLGGPEGGGLVEDLVAALDGMAVGRPVLVPLDYREAHAALGRGEIDLLADYADLLPRARRWAGIPLRAVRMGTEVYSSGLVAADRIPDALVTRVRAAIVESLERQRRDPARGLDDWLRRYPGVEPADVLESWSLCAENIFTGAPPGSMEAARWARTIGYVARACRLPAPAPASVYRTNLAVAASA